MTPKAGTNKILTSLTYFLYLLFFVSLIFSFRALSSISIGLIFLTGLFSFRTSYKQIIQQKAVVVFLCGCMACFILQLISILYTSNTASGWSHLQIATGLVVVPPAVVFTYDFLKKNKERLLFHLVLLLLGASIYCLIMAAIQYSQIRIAASFFYHDLVSPLAQHAVYFSVILFAALVYLVEKTGEKNIPVSRWVHILLIGYFSFFLLLLSSKLVIIFYAIYILVFVARLSKTKTVSKPVAFGLAFLFLSVAAIVLFTSNPLSRRFNNMVNGKVDVITQKRFTPAEHFNGIEFRELQWKFVAAILTENKRWLLGVSPGDAQQYLDQKYISTNMYIGDPVLHDKGFLGYNTHNQFLQSLLQNGIPGALLFLVTCTALLVMTRDKKKRGFTAVILLLVIYSFVESMFETQYGIILFTFLPLFLFPDEIPPVPDTIRDPVSS
jgi:O-antigen ligase